MRDVAPKVSFQQIGKLLASLTASIRSDIVKLVIVLGTMEVDTWFIAEYTHFSRRDPSLTIDNLRFLYPALTGPIEEIPNPAQLLENIYFNAGLSFKKTRADVDALVDSLELKSIFNQVPSRTPAIVILLEVLKIYLPQKLFEKVRQIWGFNVPFGQKLNRTFALLFERFGF